MIRHSSLFAVCLLGAATPLVAQQGFIFESSVSRQVDLFVEATPAPVTRPMTVFTGRLRGNQEEATRASTLLVSDGAPPPPVTGLQAQLSPTGDRVALDWSAYPWLTVGDVARYEIYLSETPFTDVSQEIPGVMTETLPVTQTQLVFENLERFRDRFVSIVAIDGEGNRNTLVNTEPLFVLMPELISRPLTTYSGALRGNPDESSRLSTLVTVDADPPSLAAGFTVEMLNPRGTEIRLDWSNYNTLAELDVDRFELFASENLLQSVADLEPSLVLRADARAATLSFETPERARYFGVVAVDGLGNRNVLLEAKGAYTLFPEVLSRVTTTFAGALQGNPDEASRNISYSVYDSAPPPAIGALLRDSMSTKQFRSVHLDWSDYNFLSVGDIDRYQFYYSEEEFFDLNDATKHPSEARNGATSIELNLPASLTTFFIAVVPVDVGGNFVGADIPNLTISSVGGISPPSALRAFSQGDGILFQWDAPPEEEAPFVAGYRVSLPNEVTVNIDGDATQWHSDDAPEGLIYPFFIAAIDTRNTLTPAVSPPAPEPVPVAAQAGFLIETDLIIFGDVRNAAGKLAEVFEDENGRNFLFFQREPILPITERMTSGMERPIPAEAINLAFFMEPGETEDRAYFGIRSADLLNWKQFTNIVPGLSRRPLIVPIDQQKQFFQILSW